MKSLTHRARTVLMQNKIFWVPPLIICFLLIIILVLLTKSGPIHAPFLYTTF